MYNLDSYFSQHPIFHLPMLKLICCCFAAQRVWKELLPSYDSEFVFTLSNKSSAVCKFAACTLQSPPYSYTQVQGFRPTFLNFLSLCLLLMKVLSTTAFCSPERRNIFDFLKPRTRFLSSRKPASFLSRLKKKDTNKLHQQMCLYIMIPRSHLHCIKSGENPVCEYFLKVLRINYSKSIHGTIMQPLRKKTRSLFTY